MLIVPDPISMCDSGDRALVETSAENENSAREIVFRRNCKTAMFRVVTQPA